MCVLNACIIYYNSINLDILSFNVILESSWSRYFER